MSVGGRNGRSKFAFFFRRIAFLELVHTVQSLDADAERIIRFQ